MAIRDDFFTALNKGAKWDVGVSINRTNPLPLDVNSVFDTKDNLDAYVAGAFAYPGQIVALVEESATTIYYIDQDKALHEVGKKPVGDNKTVAVAEDGTISLANLAGAETGSQPVLQADGSISWIKPDTTTVKGLTTAVESLGNRATALEDKVGDDSKGLVKEVADLTTDVSGVKSDLADNYYNKEAVDGLVSGAFHFRGNAKELNAEGNLIGTDDKVITGNVGDVYQIGDKEYAYNGSVWVELGFTLDLTAYATTASVTTAVNDAKTELEGKIATAKSEAISDANGYTDTAITNLGIGDYAKTTEVTAAIGNAKTELTEAIATAKSEAITTAGNNADTKIATKVGEIGDITVKAYVDGKETTLNSSIKAVDDKVAALGTLASKSEVTETDLATALATKINGKADKADSLAGYGITDAYTKTEIDGKVSTIEGSIGTNTSAIAAINNETTGILAQAKTYADGKDTAIADAKKAGTDAQTAVNALSDKVGTVTEGKTVVEMIAEAQSAATYDDTAIKADIKANTDAITVLNGESSVTGSVKNTVATEIAKVVADAPESFDTLKEIADWIANDTTGAAKMANDIATIVGEDSGKSMRAVATEVAEAAVGAIPSATMDTLGLIKGTAGKVNVENGQITSVTTDALEQGTDTLVLDGGSASN